MEASVYECCFLIVDFEALTPAGRPVEPVEVATLALRHAGGAWRAGGRFSSLIRPPADVPVPASNISGFTASMLRNAPQAAVVLGGLDRRLASPPYRLVAHGAATEAGIIARSRDACPNLAATALIDTVAMARAALPRLGSYTLDSVLTHYQIRIPRDRHRAGPDVAVTAQAFLRLLEDGEQAGRWHDLPSLERAAGRAPQQHPEFVPGVGEQLMLREGA